MLTLHHLNYSRSTRILCALEELGLEYEVVRYERDAHFRAPPEIARVHPLGKSPVLQDGDLIIGESAVILAYLNDIKGDGHLAPSPGTADRVRHDEWLQFVESTFAFPLMTAIIAARRGGLTGVMGDFVKANSRRMLDMLGAGLADPEGFVTGPDFTLADIQFSYVLEMARSVGMLEDRPTIAAYLDRILSRDSMVRSLEIGGPMAPPGR